MTEHTTLFEHAGARYEVPELPMEDLLKRRDRKRRAQRITAGVVGVAVFVVAIWIVASITSSDRSQKPVAPIAPPPKGIFSGIGGWITLQRVDGIGAVAPDGSDKTVLLHGRDVEALDWSPDGSRLLVARHGKDLAVIEPDGSETTLIRFDDDTYMDTHVAGASFSPDGSTVVYATNPGNGNYPGQMWTVASDGSGEPTLLLESGGHECGNGATCFTMLYEPTYSPDGSQIAYADGFGDSTHTLRVVNADGTDVRVLIDATPPFDEIGHLAGLAWSPDGSVLALASGDHGIYTIRADGTDYRLLIPEAVSPAYSPDGSMIAYSSVSSHDAGVWIANTDGSDPRKLPADGSVGLFNPGGPADQA